ncbi:transposase family protein [Herbidospora mongoliensis]|uniref:transposase family protein n=1 Tax=Herbidospora mongoliensis TaxID=688067 RepID=UPI0034E238A9
MPLPCPACGTVSIRQHSRYRRRLADTALGERRMEIFLSVRRLTCVNETCDKKTFAEQVEALAHIP